MYQHQGEITETHNYWFVEPLSMDCTLVDNVCLAPVKIHNQKLLVHNHQIMYYQNLNLHMAKYLGAILTNMYAENFAQLGVYSPE